MAYDMTGTLKLAYPAQSFGSKGFVKREFVVETSDKYPQAVKFELLKDKAGLVDHFSMGQEVKVTFDVRGNEHNGRYYVSLIAWKMEPAGNNGGAGGRDRREPEPQAPASSWDGDEIAF